MVSVKKTTELWIMVATKIKRLRAGQLKQESSMYYVKAVSEWWDCLLRLHACTFSRHNFCVGPVIYLIPPDNSFLDQGQWKGRGLGGWSRPHITEGNLIQKRLSGFLSENFKMLYYQLFTNLYAFLVWLNDLEKVLCRPPLQEILYSVNLMPSIQLFSMPLM